VSLSSSSRGHQRGGVDPTGKLALGKEPSCRNLEPHTSDADWTTKREIVRVHVQRIEIGPTKVTLVLRLPTETSKRPLDPIMVTSSRAWKLPANANGLAQCLQVRRTARKSLDC